MDEVKPMKVGSGGEGLLEYTGTRTRQPFEKQ